MPEPQISKELGLAKYDAMCQAIAECHRADEAKHIRDQARAIEVYAKQAKNREAELKAAEIRLRAERRTGELLKEMKKNGTRTTGHAPMKKVESETPIPPKQLKDMGITPDQSSQWQRLAEVPQADFEKAIKNSGGVRPTTEGIINADTLRKDPMPQIDSNALWLWGRLKDFERNGTLDRDVSELVSGMTKPMKEDCERIVPQLIAWLKGGSRGKNGRAELIKLRNEIDRRRKENECARARRRWNVDAVLKVELIQLLDWIESEMDKIIGVNGTVS